jgi:hypothetical protein
MLFIAGLKLIKVMALAAARIKQTITSSISVKPSVAHFFIECLAGISPPYAESSFSTRPFLEITKSLEIRFGVSLCS